MNMAKPVLSQFETWKSNAVMYQQGSIRHFGLRKIGYWNSHTDLGYIVQLSSYSVEYKHRITNRKTMVIVVDMVEQQYIQEHFKACIVVAQTSNRITYVKWVKYEDVPMACINASMPGEYGDLRKYVDENNLLKDPKHIVSVCLHQFEELWS